MKKVISITGLLLAAGLLFAPLTNAAEFISAPDDDGNVTLSSTESHRNAYVAGSSLFVNSPTTGDLYAAGRIVTIEGSVEQDLVLAAGDVNVNGPVGGDVRIVSGNVTVNNTVAGDLLVISGSLHLTEKSSIGGDVFVGGGDVIIDGPVKGTVKINGGKVTLNSAMTGQVKVTAGHSLTFGNKANIPTTVYYQGPKEAIYNEGAVVSGIDFKQYADKKEGRAGHILASIFTIIFVIKAISLILAGLLLMKPFPRTARESVESMHRNIWTNLGLGAVGLIFLPIAAIILMITFVGFYIGILAGMLWVIMLLLSALVASIYVGAWIISKLTKKDGMVYDWQALVIGVIVIGLIMLIPFIGGLAFFILMLMAFGGLMRQFYSRIQSEQRIHGDTLNN